MLVQIYVHGTIFYSTNEVMVDEFVSFMTRKFQMRVNRGINFFLGLQIKQLSQGIFNHQEKYTTKLLKESSMDNCSSAKVPIAFGYKIKVDPIGESFD